MMGTVAGEAKKFVTNITAAMTTDFAALMRQIEKEANEGAFKTKGQAVRRRDQRVANKGPAATAGDTEQPAATAGDTELAATAATAVDRGGADIS